MSRRPATILWAGSIPAAVLLATLSACGSPNRDTVAATPPAAEPTASTAPAKSPPAASATPPEPSGSSESASVAAAPPSGSAAAAPEVPPEVAPETTAPAVAAASPPTEPPPDPVKQLFESEARRVEYEQKLAGLLAARDAAAADVTQREKDLLAYKNPYLPRPKATAEEAEALKGKGGADRAQWAEAQIADAKAKLEAAQKAYDDARLNPPNN